jgi:hypothetical protein
MPEDRPHGHMGAKSSRLAADRAVLKENFGRFYPFVQRLGGTPVIYFVMGAIMGRPHGWTMAILYAVVAAVYSFIFHIAAISYFAARSKMAIDKCPKGTIGYFWGSEFIPRALFDHAVMMTALILSGRYGPWWFLASGLVLYTLDHIITFLTMLSCPAETGKNKSIKEQTGGIKS